LYQAGQKLQEKNKDFAFFSESVYSAEIQPICLPSKTCRGVGFPRFFDAKRAGAMKIEQASWPDAVRLFSIFSE
jgi:hypothetical protein